MEEQPVAFATTMLYLGVSHTVVWVGLYSGGNRLRLRLPLTSQNQAPLRGSCPQGVTIPNAAGEPPLPLATQGTAYSATPCKTKNSCLIFLSGRSNVIQVMSFTAMRHFPLPSFRWGNLPRSSRKTRSYSSLFPCEVSGAPSSGQCGCSRR